MYHVSISLWQQVTCTNQHKNKKEKDDDGNYDDDDTPVAKRVLIMPILSFPYVNRVLMPVYAP